MDFDYHVLANNYPALIDGFWLTLFISSIALCAGIVLGLIACSASLRRAGIIYRASRLYVDFFRATPELVLIFWAYFCLPPILDVRMSGLTVGTLVLSLVAGAFIAEIFRAGIQAIPRGQIEAAEALAIPTYYRWLKIMLPQAVRRMMPALINYATELLKVSTLLAAIGVQEVAFEAYSIGARTFRYMESLSAVAVFFFVVIFPISLYVRRAESRLVRQTGN